MAASQSQALRRLIDRQLIWQQMKQSLNRANTAGKDPQPQANLCGGKDGKEDGVSGLQAYGVTPQSLHEFCSLQASELGFIEQRFRSSVHISQDEIATYYRDQFLPEYRKTSAMPPPLSSIETKIATVLTEREVTLLLDDWLRALRAQSQIVMLPAMKVTP